MVGMKEIRSVDRQIFVRNINADNLLENFLVSSITALLTIRAFLHITGYPSITPGELHIAHMLWGGLFMLVSIVFLLSFLSNTVRSIASVIGGVGFGTFIDQLGKFITNDNDYFFEPTIALIYVIFIIMYLVFKSINRKRAFTKQEYLVNALEFTKEAVLNDLDVHEKQRALDLLRHGDRNNPVVTTLETLLKKTDTLPSEEAGIFMRVKRLARSLYKKFVTMWWFRKTIIGVFIFHSILSAVHAMNLIEGMRRIVIWFVIGVVLFFGVFQSESAKLTKIRKYLYMGITVIFLAIFAQLLINVTLPGLSILEWGELIFSISSSLLVVVGIVQIRKSRLKAYHLFKHAVLISIFLTQFFAFYKDQVSAIFGLAGNIVILLTLNYMIKLEERMVRKEKAS